MRPRLMLMAMPTVVLIAGCQRVNVPCANNGDCDLAYDGTCVKASTGTYWCAYPDRTCPSGMRYSDFEIGEGYSGVCVEAKPGPGVASVVPADGQWGAAQPITSGGQAGGAAVALTNSGGAMATWVQNDGTGGKLVAAHFVAPRGWEVPALIAEVPKDVSLPKLAMDARGGAVVVWFQVENSATSIWTSRLQAPSGWSAPRKLELTDTGEVEGPHLAVNADGDAVVVWEQNDGIRENVWAAVLD